MSFAGACGVSLLTRRTPIIMLTAKTSEAERVAGLDLGADDYIDQTLFGGVR
ncbi:MAG: hypothetical protein WKF84_21215 [Pyrinomonadaceae bacterium]